MLQNMRVLAFCPTAAAPSAVRYLAEMGATVLRVVPTDEHASRASAADQCAGLANVTTIRQDLSAGSIGTLQDHLDACNVVLDERMGDQLANAGLEPVMLRAQRPDLVYVTVTGSGSGRENSDEDLRVQARSGLIAVSGDVRKAAGAPIVEQHCAALVTNAVISAYIQRLTTGSGAFAQTSQMAAAIDLQAEPLTLWFADHAKPQALVRHRNLATWFHEAPYGVYEIADGHIALSTGPNVTRLAEALGCAELQRLATGDRLRHRDEYARLLSAELAGYTWRELDERLAPFGIWYERVAGTPAELSGDAQVIAGGMLAAAAGSSPRVGDPIKFSRQE